MDAKQLLHNISLLFVALWMNQSYAYYLSPNILNFDQAQQFCQQRCNSELASIHSGQEQYDAILSMTINPAKVWGDVSSAWIGLEPQSKSWTDKSEWDFGNDISELGVFPWDINQPSNVYECVKIELSSNRWSNAGCTKKTHALCNHCNGVINHFALVATAVTRSGAEAACSERYNSTLASVHNADEWKEIRTLQNLTSNMPAWIGLRSKNASHWQWDDERPFNFGAEVDGIDCGPWENGYQPEPADGDACVSVCVNGCWSETDCASALAYPICALQSELSTVMNGWIDPTLDWYYTGRWDFDTKRHYAISNNGTDYHRTQTVLMNKWFHNGDDVLSIEWTFSARVGDSYAGLTIFNDPSGSACHEYWIGLDWSSSSTSLYLYIGREDVLFGEVYPIEILVSAADISLDIETTMIVQIALVDEYPMFSLLLNGVELVTQWHDTTGFRVIQSGHSGYVGFWHGSGALVVNKYLYISGTPLAASFFDVNWCNELNEVPTTDPTQPPTTNATIVAIQTSPAVDIIPSSANGGNVAPTTSTVADNVDTTRQSLATLAVGVIAVILLAVIIVIAFVLCRRKHAAQQVLAANVDQHFFNADFQSIEPEPINAFGQQITTQGQDIQEIKITQ
eukprot:CAMPEP_0202706508 /NCGR_PEP_ID=MMETSP1385-20130828/18920_1 /ASSEMBLY_ACC=CAM_ASM_000861 /TAXON_ID=933848 /ORGANISM="Elphidium margaritaceum" /LENGTH=624 /DNA_ID=CAMNT_0049364997 /DNA_START=59 /DNA_END=1933 /DNA_ORIENTATION=+